MNATTQQEAFWRRVVKTSYCWNWTGATTRARYGQLSVDGKFVYAHRWSYAELVGPIPPGATLDHLCRNTICVRPDHLEPVSRSENTRRQNEAAPPQTFLSSEVLARIRALGRRGSSLRVIATSVGVSPSSVWRVLHRTPKYLQTGGRG